MTEASRITETSALSSKTASSTVSSKLRVGRGKVDCVDEGMTIMRGTVNLLYKIITNTNKTEMDLYNLAEWLFTLSDRCNYHATIQGLVVFRMIRDRVDVALIRHPKWRKFINVCLISYEAGVNMIDDSIVVAMASIGFY